MTDTIGTADTARLDAILDLVKPALLITEIPSIPDSYSDDPLLPDAVSPSWNDRCAEPR